MLFGHKFALVTLVNPPLCCGHGGVQFPEDCVQSDALCWSVITNEFEHGVPALLTPSPHTHSLSCKHQSDAVFRNSLVNLFRDQQLSGHMVHAFVLDNFHEISDLALTYDLDVLGPISRAFESVSRKADHIKLERTDCYLAYLTGKMLLPFAFGSDPLAVLDGLDKSHLLAQFWGIMLHWVDISFAAWPILKLFKFMAKEVYISRRHRSSLIHPIAREIWQSLQSLQSGSPQWTWISLKAATSYHPSSRADAMVAAHLSSALAIMQREDVAASAEVQLLVATAMNWAKAAPTSNDDLSRVMQLIYSEWPIFSLWDLVAEHPHADRFFSRHLCCPSVYDSLWSVRYHHVNLLTSRLIPSFAVFEKAPITVTAGTIPMSREAWVTTVAVKGGSCSRGSPWIDAVRVLHRSVRQFETGTRREFLVAIPSDLDVSQVRALEMDGLHPLVLEPEMPPVDLALCSDVQLRAESFRLKLFGLTEYDRLVYLDADTLVVGPLDHLFHLPPGLFLSATINGSRWTYREAGNLADGALPVMLNTGVMSISPDETFLPQLRKWFAQTWSVQDYWATSAADGAPELGVFMAYCTQGLIDAAMLAGGRRLDEAMWSDDGVFLGCGEELAMPGPSEHCTIGEAYNLQVTRPHLDWHEPFLQDLADTRAIRVLHWPGSPKPWALVPSQRTDFESQWWRLHQEICSNSGALISFSIGIDTREACAISCDFT